MATTDLKLFTLENLRQERAFKILLSHRPEYTHIFTQLPFELIMSGHTHGGQVRIPYLLNGLYAPHQGLFPRYVGGAYRLNNSQNLIISRGLSFNMLLPRIFNPPEVVFITLQPQ